MDPAIPITTAMETTLKPGIESFDYVIVGAGTAGCLLANRLSADKDATVLLLEAGGPDNYHWIHIPVGYLYCINNPRTDWCYATEPQDGLGGRAINYARGRGLGGCSSINGMVYMRGQARDYDEWSALGNQGWSWQEVLPYFKRHEDFVHGASDFHGSGGEWRVEEQRLHWPILDVFRQACVQAGIPETSDFNRGDNLGVGYFQVNQRRGLRVNTSRAFLRPAKTRSNLTIWTGAQAKSITIRERWATGVSVIVNGQPREVHARREVLLCSGAVNTPQLLELSGVGQSGRIHDLGVRPVHELPGVGENLQDHLQVRLVYTVENAKTLNTLANSWVGKAKIAAQYALTQSGPMSMAPSQLGVFAKSDPGQATANVQYHIQPLSLERFGEPLHKFPAITASVCNLRPSSRGSVHAKSADFTEAPSIDPRYLSTDEDRKVLVDAVRLTRKIMSSPVLNTHQPSELKPGRQHESDEDIGRVARDSATTIFHPVGTAKMGHDRMAVVDEQLKVHGIRGLRVVDASVMPTITSGNTNAPTLMIAEKAAEMILKEHRARVLVPARPTLL